MGATSDAGRGWLGRFAIKVKAVLLPVRCPTLLEGVCMLGRGNTESDDRQDHGTNTDVGLGAFADISTSRALEDWRTDVPLGSNSLKHYVQAVS